MKPQRFVKEKFIQQHYSKEEIEMIRNEINACVNSYYVLCEASDMLLRNCEELFNSLGEGLKHRIKQRHNEMMLHVKAMNTIMDTFFDDYNCFGTGQQFVDKIDMLRSSAAFISRLVLLIGDRSCREDEKEILRKIEDYIYYMPEQGLINDKILDKFRWKKL